MLLAFPPDACLHAFRHSSIVGIISSFFIFSLIVSQHSSVSSRSTLVDCSTVQIIPSSFAGTVTSLITKSNCSLLSRMSCQSGRFALIPVRASISPACHLKNSLLSRLSISIGTVVVLVGEILSHDMSKLTRFSRLPFE